MSHMIQDQPQDSLECTILNSLGDGLREVLIVPIGESDTVKGKMILSADDARFIIESFKHHAVSIPIDYEHSTLRSETLPHGAPAAGWVDDLYFNENRGLMGLVRWNNKGRDSIRSDEFRYLSPVVLLDRDTKHVRGLHSAALTTKPAIPRMERLAASANTLLIEEFNTMPEESNLENMENQGLVTELAKALNLPEGYTNNQLLTAAIEAAKKANGIASKPSDSQVAEEVRNSLGLPKDAGVDAVRLSMSVATNGSSSKELMAMRAAESQRITDERVQTYIDQGKLNPNHEAQMCSARKLAKTDPETFTTIMEAAAPIVPQGATTPPRQESVQRGRVVREAMNTFNQNEQLKKTTTLGAFVNMQLTEAGLERMTDEDRRAFSIAVA